MTQKTKTFLKKSLFDIVFSISAFVVFVALYCLLCIIFEDIITYRTCHGYVEFIAILGGFLHFGLGANIPIQIILNIFSVKNKIKSCIFFVALITGVIGLVFFFSDDFYFFEWSGIFFALFLAIVFIFIKYFIAKYYYKLLNKKFLTLNS